MNGQYQGVYVFMEKIKRDSARVNISKLEEDDTTGSAVTGGYIIKIDKGTGNGDGGWTSNYLPSVNTNGQTIYYQYDYPKDTKIQPQQQQYIQKFVDSFEHALHDFPLYDLNIGWRKYGDEQSFIKYFILNELSKNVDGYRLSTYLYKTKETKGNKLYIGPPWDYDLGFHNADYCGGSDDTGWAYKFGSVCDGDYFQVPFWWERLMQDTVFQNNLRCAYNTLRATILDTTILFSYIDSNTALLNAAQVRNFESWPILGTYVWPNPSPIPVDYTGEIAELKQFLRNRLNWLDNNIPGNCIDLSSPVVRSQLSCTAYPNPFNNNLTIEINTRTAQIFNIGLYGIDGRLILSRALQSHTGNNVLNIETGRQSIQPGVYILQMQGDEGYWTIKMIKD